MHAKSFKYLWLEQAY
uniref:Uncharacterized protein n=1 Tax=Arundo donax TaxID=35708 RepID=A0A0A9FPP7_ARUDO